MPYYHGTRRHSLPLIQKHGLGGIDPGPTSAACERGVYLSSDPMLSVAVLTQQFFETATDEVSPAEWLGSWVFLLIDDTRIDRRKLVPDPHFGGTGSWLYSGVIDVTNAPVLELEDIERAETVPGSELPLSERFGTEPVEEAAFSAWLHNTPFMRRRG